MTRTILLADDSVTIQKVIELTFMEEDYEVVSAGDGDEALERLEEITPDFVIADVHMPGASGIDVCRRSKELHPDVPVLLLVGTFEPFDEGAAQAAGADAHLKKPFDSQELIQLVGDLMAAPGDEAAPRPEAAGEPSAAEAEADDTWGFSAAAAELQAAEEEPAAGAAGPPAQAGAGDEAVADLDWAGPLEPLPEEEAPPAAAQAEEPAPGWGGPAEAASAAAAAGEPFQLGPVERAGGGGDVFDLGDETADGSPEPAEPAAGDAWAAEGWGFAVDEAGEAESAAPGDTGWQEVEEPSEDAAEGTREEPEAEARAAAPAWDEPAHEEAPGAAAEAEPGSEEARVAAPPPDWDAEAESGVTAPPPDWDAEGDESEVSAPPPDWDGEEESRVAAPPPDWDGEAEAAAEEPAEEWTAGDSGVAEPVPGSGAAYGGAEVAAPPASATGTAAATGGGLSEHDVDRIARRVAELLGERVTREVAWEVVPDLAEVVIRERLRELEGQID